jgi:hypothetical protein
MGHPEIPKIEELSDEGELWQVYCEIHRKKGFDVAQFYSALAARTENAFESYIKKQFRLLCAAGCVAEGLALSAEILKCSPDLQKAWTDFVGHADNRQKRAIALEKAAKTLEFLFGNALPMDEQFEIDLTNLGGVPVSQLTYELRKYANFVTLAERLSNDTETRSLVEFSKYLLTSYVKRMTGDFHDMAVSALIGDLIGPSDYSETAQSQWRYRNYDRLDGHHSQIVKFLVAMSVVVAHAR